MMDVEDAVNVKISRIAAAIGESARARMLYGLMDGHARTSTELSIIAEVSPSTASVHLNRLMAAGLIKLLIQGKHRYYSLEGPHVAGALEGLSVLAGRAQKPFIAHAPARLRVARTCYDHMAGAVGVSLHDSLRERGWLLAPSGNSDTYEVTPKGVRGFELLGIDIDQLRSQRRRFVGPCLDWSERRPHIAGAVGSAFLVMALKKRWVLQELHSRALDLTALGRRELKTRFGVEIGEV